MKRRIHLFKLVLLNKLHDFKISFRCKFKKNKNNYTDYLILVNSNNKINDCYESNLNLIKYKNLLKKTVFIEYVTFNNFIELRKKLSSKGIYVDIYSAYRSIKKQQLICDEMTINYGEEYVRKYVAAPGYSEHHTGLAIDIFLIKNSKTIINNDALLAEKEIFSEIHKLLADYGFILRFPYGEKLITGYDYEPWHIRFVGKEPAKEIMNKNITLEQYLN